MKRILSIYLPLWSVELNQLRHQQQKATAQKKRLPKDEQLLLFTHHGRQQTLAACSPAAESHGVERGMSLVHAKALVPNARVQVHNPQYEAKALHKLAHRALQFSPLVSVDANPTKTPSLFTDHLYQGLNLDVSGTERLHGGEENLTKTIHQKLKQLGFSSQIAIAPTLGCAWALSRYGRKIISTVDEDTVFQELAPLPTAALRLPLETMDALHEVGIDYIEHLFPLPPSSLVSRFGLLLLQHLRFALGHKEEIVKLLHAHPSLKKKKAFSGPITESKVIQETVRHLLQELLQTLEQQQKKTSCIELTFARVRASQVTKTITLNVPSTSLKHIWSLLRPRIETINVGDGVEAITVTVKNNTFFVPHHLGISPKYSTNQNFHTDKGELVDTLTHHLGAENIAQMKFAESHIPEKSFFFTSFASNKKENSSPSRPPSLARPSILFDSPKPIRVVSLLPDNPPHWIRWQGQSHRVKTGFGPERIAPEWWNIFPQEHQYSFPALQQKKHAHDCNHNDTRDYFTIQLPSGTWLWIFRERKNSSWFVHGIWC